VEYTVNKLAQLSGVSTRTLRYYDQIDILKPAKISSNGYRIYGQSEVDTLQQIRFYRELGFALDEVKSLMSAPDFDREQSLQNHLTALQHKKSRIEALIDNVTKTIDSLKGKTIMSDQEKFEGFKQKLVDDNEALYGKEIREKYGDAVIDATNAKVKGMSEEQWQKAESLRTELEALLKTAFEQGNPASDEAQRVCDLHRQWLCVFWKDGAYSKEAHINIAEMYTADERFAAYYDKIAIGCAGFLRDAINIYCG